MFMYRLVYFFLLLATAVSAQETGASLGYNYAALYNAEATSFTRHQADFSSKEYTRGNSTLSYNLGISAYSFDYDANNPAYNSDGLKYISAVSAGVGYRYKVTDKWSAAATFTPKLISDFKNSGIQDIYPGFTAGAHYKSGSTTLEVGVGYQGYFGKYRFMPVINYAGKLGSHIAFNLGIPATWIEFKANATHAVKAMAYSEGFYSRISGSSTIVENGISSAIKAMELVTVNTALEYNYTSGADWVASIRGGYSIYNKLSLPLQYGDQSLNLNKNIFISAGFKYFLNFN